MNVRTSRNIFCALALVALASGCFENGPGRNKKKSFASASGQPAGKTRPSPTPRATYTGRPRPGTTTTTVPGTVPGTNPTTTTIPATTTTLPGTPTTTIPPAPPADAYLERNWVYHGPRTFEFILRNELKITGTNRNPGAEAAILTQLQARAHDLGKSNYAAGISESLQPAPGLFKFITEISNEACFLAAQDESVRSRLFPGVTGSGTWSQSSFSTIYLRILGREPSATEKNLLMSLTNSIPAYGNPNHIKQAAAVCAAVLSSLEANNAR